MHTIRFTEQQLLPLPALRATQTKISLARTEAPRAPKLQSAQIKIARQHKERPPNTIFFSEGKHQGLPPSGERRRGELTFIGKVERQARPSSLPLVIQAPKKKRPPAGVGPRPLLFDEEIIVSMPDTRLPIREISPEYPTLLPPEDFDGDPYRGGPSLSRVHAPAKESAPTTKPAEAATPPTRSKGWLLFGLLLASLLSLIYLFKLLRAGS